jgi:arsenate reductase (glutaredoxin)
MITVYHNPRCSKSRCCLEYLDSKNAEYEVVKYLDTPPSIMELTEIVSKLGIKPLEIVRKSEAIYKEEYKGKELTDEEWIIAMCENPKLIERPIVIKGDKAVVARPTENVDSII